ncbi:MAG: hypothetical protein HQ593_04805 [Candidatus Omnitrophica bacterium]|nr:hypothetical protein [Candidatus Omnitrophota bacterium]
MKRSITTLICLRIFLAASLVLAQGPPAAPLAAEGVPMGLPSGGEGSLPPGEMTDADMLAERIRALRPDGDIPNISMDFKDASLRAILKLLSQQSGLNFVSGSGVEDMSITLYLDDIPINEAITTVLGANGLVYESAADGKVFIVQQPIEEAVGGVETKTKVFTFEYTKIGQTDESRSTGMIEIFEKMLSEAGSLTVDEKTNSVVVTDTEETFERIDDVIKELDTPTPQVLIEARIMNISLTETEKMGINWTVGATITAAGPVFHTFPFQKKSSMGEYGATLTGTAAGEELPSKDISSGFTFGTLDPSAFSAVLELLKSRTDTKTLSNPRIVVSNDQTANIHVGDTKAIPTYERNDTTGTFEITGYDEKEFGVTLDVTPHVSKSGIITLEVKPEVSAFDDWETVSGDIRAPSYTTTEAETTVDVKDGETLVIGGLIKEEKTKTTNKVPFLGDIPVLGRLLFKKTEDQTETKELIFFVTVHLVRPREIKGVETSPVGVGQLTLPQNAPLPADKLMPMQQPLPMMQQPFSAVEQTSPMQKVAKSREQEIEEAIRDIYLERELQVGGIE